ncbi:MAG TPA: DNA-3-methyladenine glycosylase [Gemmatimonadaceae bacterium]|nr:DNA-3-methyladenine glycosylase [Gemmatimonadaceae bacterium]
MSPRAPRSTSSENAAREFPARRSRPGEVLPISFYDRDTRVVARELLGAVLECETSDGLASGRIVETEAYLGADDPACHAVAGLTERTRHLHGPPGIAYVYLIYGAHWCFNAKTEREGNGSAVLVRAIEPVDGEALMRRRRPTAKRDVDLTNGPGKLCAALGVTGVLDGVPLTRPPLVIRSGDVIADRDIDVTPRIGITRAADLPLRWLVRGSPWVSRTPVHFPRRPLVL